MIWCYQLFNEPVCLFYFLPNLSPIIQSFWDITDTQIFCGVVLCSTTNIIFQLTFPIVSLNNGLSESWFLVLGTKRTFGIIKNLILRNQCFLKVGVLNLGAWRNLGLPEVYIKTPNYIQHGRTFTLSLERFWLPKGVCVYVMCGVCVHIQIVLQSVGKRMNSAGSSRCLIYTLFVPTLPSTQR